LQTGQTRISSKSWAIMARFYAFISPDETRPHPPGRNPYLDAVIPEDPAHFAPGARELACSARPLTLRPRSSDACPRIANLG
jgi:hypothetical protein